MPRGRVRGRLPAQGSPTQRLRTGLTMYVLPLTESPCPWPSSLGAQVSGAPCPVGPGGRLRGGTGLVVSPSAGTWGAGSLGQRGLLGEG